MFWQAQAPVLATLCFKVVATYLLCGYRFGGYKNRAERSYFAVCVLVLIYQSDMHHADT